MLTINGHAQRLTNQMFWAGFSSVAYLPSSIAPLGLTAEGLPVGVQIVANKDIGHRELSIARVAKEGSMCRAN